MAHSFSLSREILLVDLHAAYLQARQHKRFRQYQLLFEANLQENLANLADELFRRQYKPRPSTCFIIEDPKKREVFAADFRDRIVHHLYFNYTHQIFERTFIADSYSCIKGRGTHFGIQRLQGHIRKASLNYSEKAYVLQMDIRGYFMNIDRRLLLNICLASLDKCHCRAHIDMDFVRYLTKELVLLDPVKNCIIVGQPDQWHSLPHDKSLFHSADGCGLPIGNLTSQLFSNIYLNVLDQFMKRQLLCRHYGRYVDDFFVVAADIVWLRGLIPQVRQFLSNELGLSLHEGKTRISEVHRGLSFLGAYVKPWRCYVRNETLRRIQRKVANLDLYAAQNPDDDELPLMLRDSLSSFGGVLSHFKTYTIRAKIWNSLQNVWSYGYFDPDQKKFIIFRKS